MRSSLATYRQKRNFARTSEPEGKLGPSGGKLAFVVQKHNASHLHFDLRLEIGGVFKSWAVPKGPSLDPADKRLAVEVEDHPLDYGDFEGTIPEGQYGGGTVQLWDRGAFHPDPGNDPLTALSKGRLSFELDGEHMRGGWSLVRLRPRRDTRTRGRSNWLLMKANDRFARTGRAADIAAIDRSVKTGRTMKEIGSGRAAKPKQSSKAESLRKGPAIGKQLHFIPPQLARLAEHPPAGPGWVHEIKFDGYRIQAGIAAGRSVLWSRNGLDWTAKFPQIAEMLAMLPECRLDGEIVAFDSRGHPDFAALQQALTQRETGALTYFVFDLLEEGGEDRRDLPLTRRKALLQTIVPAGSARLRFVEHFGSGGDAVLESACRMALEGVISKRADSPYRSGRSDSWIKTKCRGREEFVVGGYTRGKGGRLGALLVGMPQEGRLVYKGRVGTGFSGAVLDALKRELAERHRRTGPFAAFDDPRIDEVVWVKPDLVAEVEYGGWTRDGLLRHAAFKGLRADKKPADVAVDREPSEAVMRLSSPDKPLWAKPKITKADLRDYYLASAERLMPFVADRPLSLLRAPDGIDRKTFFQRHAMAGMSALIETVKIPGDRKPYVFVRRPEALAALAQIAAVEIHPWGARVEDIERPDQLTFDLDPAEGVGFAALRRAALWLRELLRQLELGAFLKLTGGKGLHVVVPLRPRAKWGEAKGFARAVVELMAEKEPNAYTANMRKTARTNRIFLDYLRNGRSATAVAAWSPRARPGAPLAVPVAWSLLEKKRALPRFTLDRAATAVKGSDPWTDYDAARRALPRPAELRKLS